MTFTPIREDNGYVAAGKQISGLGSPVTPNYFFRWLDGSGLEPDLKTEELWEGDSSRHLSQVFKNGQRWKVKLITYARPDLTAFLETAAQGLGSDAYTVPLITTSTVAITQGVSTTATLASVAGLGSSGTVTLMFDKGLTTEEMPVFNLPPSSSVLTLAASYNNGTGKFAQSHVANCAVQGPANHTITDQYDGQYYTFEVCLGAINGGAGDTYRIRDCKVTTMKRSSEKGKPVTLEIEVIGIACAVQSSPTTVLLENRPNFIFQQASFTVNGSGVSTIAVGVYKFSIEQSNNVDEGIQVASVNNAAFIYGNVTVKVMFDFWMQDLQLVRLAHLGSTTGTADSQTIGTGAFIVLLSLPDQYHSIQYSVASMAYAQAKPPMLKKDGKAFVISAEGVGNSNMQQLATILTTIITNAITAQY